MSTQRAACSCDQDAGAHALPLPVEHVTGEQTRSGVVVLAGESVVDAGGVLRFAGATVVGVDAGITVASGGRLELVNGTDPITQEPVATSVRALAGSLRITVDAGGTLIGDGASLAGTLLRSSGATTLTGTDVDLTGGSLAIQAGATRLTGGAVHNGVTDLVTVSGGSLEADGTVFSLAGRVGISAAPGASVTLRTISMSSVQSYGVTVDGATLLVEGSAFTATGDYGIQTVGSNVTLTGNTFEGHCGAYIGQGGSGSATGNDFATTLGGLTVYAATTFTATGNRFTGIDHGLTVSGAAVDASENRFEDNRVGIWVMNASPALSRNRFLGNEEGVSVIGSGSAPVLRDNAFDSAGTALRNTGSATVDARWNFWNGEPNTAGAAVVAGAALLAPWLTDPPSGV